MCVFMVAWGEGGMSGLCVYSYFWEGEGQGGGGCVFTAVIVFLCEIGVLLHCQMAVHTGVLPDITVPVDWA